jgi:hypothetical protein
MWGGFSMWNKAVQRRAAAAYAEIFLLTGYWILRNQDRFIFL